MFAPVVDAHPGSMIRFTAGVGPNAEVLTPFTRGRSGEAEELGRRLRKRQPYTPSRIRARQA